MQLSPRIGVGLGLAVLMLALVLVVLAMRRPTKVVDLVASLERHPSDRYSSRDMSRVNEITIHHTAGYEGPEAIAHYHVYERGWPGIGYHYVIDQNGRIFQTNYDETKSYHNGTTNTKSIGVALIGNFENHPPTHNQYQAAKELVEQLRSRYPSIQYILPHNHHKATACPGAFLDLTHITPLS